MRGFSLDRLNNIVEGRESKGSSPKIFSNSFLVFELESYELLSVIEIIITGSHILSFLRMRMGVNLRVSILFQLLGV